MRGGKTTKGDVVILSTDVVPAVFEPVEIGSMVVVSHVSAIHAGRDIKEQVRNLLGGRMTSYEELLQEAAEDAIAKLKASLAAEGWHGAFAVRFSHPSLVEGGCEVLLSGTPFRSGDEESGPV